VLKEGILISKCSAHVTADEEAKGFKVENGRRYHDQEEDAYFLPNDVSHVVRHAI
jgi:hypothetical protein